MRGAAPRQPFLTGGYKNCILTFNKFTAIDYLALAVVAIQATSLYGVVGLLLRIPEVKFMSIISLSLATIYIFIRFADFRGAFSMPSLANVIGLILLVPILIMAAQAVTGILTVDGFVYWVSFIYLYAAILIASAIISFRSPPRRLRQISLAFLIIIACEFAFNFVSFDLTREVLVYIKSIRAASLTMGRTGGFFGHPNDAALTIVLCCLLFTASARAQLTYSSGLILATGMLMILLTGSRTSMIALSILTTLLTLKTLFKERSGFLKIIFFAVFMLSAAIVIFIIISQIVDANFLQDMIDRTLSISGALSSSGNDDVSVSIRLAMINTYISLISHSPFLGVGMEQLQEYTSSGRIVATSQNSWIQWSVEYGLFYGIYAFVSIIWIVISAFKARFSKGGSVSSDLMLLFLIIVTFLMFSLDDIFLYRGSSAVFGFVIGQFARGKRLQFAPRSRTFVPALRPSRNRP